MYLTARQFATEVGLPYCFVLKLCRENELPYLKNGQKKLIPFEAGIRALQALAFEEMESKQTETPALKIDFKAALKTEKDAYRRAR